jgi:hypothetical protein
MHFTIKKKRREVSATKKNNNKNHTIQKTIKMTKTVPHQKLGLNPSAHEGKSVPTSHKIVTVFFYFYDIRLAKSLWVIVETKHLHIYI